MTTTSAAHAAQRIHQAPQREPERLAPVPLGTECPLDTAREFASQVLWMPGPALDALVLAAAASHVLDAWQTVPRILASSDGPQSGKGHPHGTGILTPGGYVPVENLQPGDLVIGSTGRPVKVTDIYRRGELPVYRVTFNDGSSVRVDGEHLWSVRAHNDVYRGGACRTIATEELAGTLGRRWEIPMAGTVEMDARDLPVDPYVLGVILGDGTVYDSGGVRFNTGEDATVDEVARRLPAGYFLNRTRPDVQITRGIYGKGRKSDLRETLKALGLAGKRSHDKFVPSEYLYASAAQRLDLLRGLMDTDGHLYRMTTGFASASEVLCDQVRFLVESFGGVARKRVKRAPKYRHNGEVRTGRDSYELTINMPVNPFLTREGWAPYPHKKPKRVIKSIEPDGIAPVTCIRVDADDHLYLTEHCIVTHNTTLLDVLRMLANAAWDGTGATSYAMRARFNEPEPPFVIIDEISDVFGQSGRRGSGNPIGLLARHGYRRTAKISMAVDRMAEDVPAFAFMAFGGLRTAIPADIRTRAIVFRMQPCPPSVRLAAASTDPEVEALAVTYRASLHAYVRGVLLPRIRDIQRRFTPPHPAFRDRKDQVFRALYVTALAADEAEYDRYMQTCELAAASGRPEPEEPALDWGGRALAAFKTLMLDASDLPALLPAQAMLRDAAEYVRGLPDGARFAFAADIKDHLLGSCPEPLWQSLTERRIEHIMAEALGESQVITGKREDGGTRRARGFPVAAITAAWDALEMSLYPPAPVPEERHYGLFDDLPEDDHGTDAS